MRRFTVTYDAKYNGHFVELSSKEVDDERKMAAKHEYAEALRETFKQIQGKREISKF